MIWERDSELMADAVERILNDNTLHMEMDKNAKRFSQQFDIRGSVDRLLELYTLYPKD